MDGRLVRSASGEVKFSFSDDDQQPKKKEIIELHNGIFKGSGIDLLYRSITSSFRKKLLSIAEVSSFLGLDPTGGPNLCMKMLPVVAGCLISDSL